MYSTIMANMKKNSGLAKRDADVRTDGDVRKVCDLPPCTNTALRRAARRMGNLYDDALEPTGLKATQVCGRSPSTSHRLTSWRRMLATMRSRRRLCKAALVRQVSLMSSTRHGRHVRLQCSSLRHLDTGLAPPGTIPVDFFCPDVRSGPGVAGVWGADGNPLSCIAIRLRPARLAQYSASFAERGNERAPARGR